ncbi:hypothetical protein Tco_1555279 [Tanacetum coccineum]
MLSCVQMAGNNERETYKAMNNGTREQAAHHLGIDVDVFKKRLWTVNILNWWGPEETIRVHGWPGDLALSIHVCGAPQNNPVLFVPASATYLEVLSLIEQRYELQRGFYRVAYPGISTLLERTVLGCHRDWTTMCSHHCGQAANPIYQGGPMRLDVKRLLAGTRMQIQAMEVVGLLLQEEASFVSPLPPPPSPPMIEDEEDSDYNPSSEEGTDDDDMDYDTSSEEVSDEDDL